MVSSETLERKCDECGAPLYLDKDECRDFVEGKLKQGYIVCSCCGRKTAAEGKAG